ncbi:MAG: DUF2029 domain-containing protein [Chloroflexaceae bacterium]|nr:DUF2029 domain-containing protein [Chloroflexaceae bacterium]
MHSFSPEYQTRYEDTSGTMMRDRWLVGSVVLTVLWYAAWSVFVVYTDRPLDYYVYVIAADVLGRGENIYQLTDYAPIAERLGITNYTSPYQYPPLTALLVWPLLLLPLRLGALVWVFGSGLAALLSALLLARHALRRWQRRVILLALPGFVPVLVTLHAGQVNALVLLATTVALHCWYQRRAVDGGVALALGLWLKPLAIALPLLLLWRWCWRALGALAATSLLVLAASIIAFGITPVLSQSSGPASLDLTSVPTNPSPPMQHLRALVSRWLLPHETGAPVFVAPQLAESVFVGLLLVFALAVLGLLWPSGRHERGLDLEIAMLIVTTHLLAPLTWYHHLTMLFIAFAVLIARWHPWQQYRGRLLLLALAYCALGVHGLFWKQLVGMTMLLDLGTWSSVVLWALLVWQLWEERGQRSAIIPNGVHRYET